MNLQINNWIITLTEKSSKSDLERIAKNNSNIIITLGEDSNWEEIFLLSVHSTNGSFRFLIAIFSESIINPSIITNDDNGYITLGFNKKISVIDLNAQKIIFEKEFSGVFVYGKYNNGRLFIISEIEILVLNKDFEELLLIPTDVIESFEFIDNFLIYKTHSGIQKIDIST